MKVLVTGGVRSGKSFHAEAMLLAEPQVAYIAPGPAADLDPDWAARVAVHRSRRPEHWTTVESADLATSIRSADGAVLVDCLGTWLTSTIDELDGWDATADDWQPTLFGRLDEALAAITEHRDTVVLVTNEVGAGEVPGHRSGQVFRELLGTINQRVAETCDDVLLVMAGRVLKL